MACEIRPNLYITFLSLFAILYYIFVLLSYLFSLYVKLYYFFVNNNDCIRVN